MSHPNNDLHLFITAVSPSSAPWFKWAVNYNSGMTAVILMRGDLPESNGPQSYNLTLRATDPADSQWAEIVITASWPAPLKTARYPISTPDSSITGFAALLTAQRARVANKWFVDVYPPQGFYLYGDYAGRKEVIKSGICAIYWINGFRRTWLTHSSFTHRH